MLDPWETDNAKEHAAVEAWRLGERRARARQQAQSTWRNHGTATRAEYDRTRAAMPHCLQDEVIRRHRAGSPRHKIVAEMANAAVTEYSVKRVLRAYRNDPQAFMADATSDILVWK